MMSGVKTLLLEKPLSNLGVLPAEDTTNNPIVTNSLKSTTNIIINIPRGVSVEGFGLKTRVSKVHINSTLEDGRYCIEEGRVGGISSKVINSNEMVVEGLESKSEAPMISLKNCVVDTTEKVIEIKSLLSQKLSIRMKSETIAVVSRDVRSLLQLFSSTTVSNLINENNFHRVVPQHFAMILLKRFTPTVPYSLGSSRSAVTLSTISVTLNKLTLIIGSSALHVTQSVKRLSIKSLCLKRNIKSIIKDVDIDVSNRNKNINVDVSPVVINLSQQSSGCSLRCLIEEEVVPLLNSLSLTVLTDTRATALCTPATYLGERAIAELLLSPLELIIIPTGKHRIGAVTQRKQPTSFRLTRKTHLHTKAGLGDKQCLILDKKYSITLRDRSDKDELIKRILENHHDSNSVELPVVERKSSNPYGLRINIKQTVIIVNSFMLKTDAVLFEPIDGKLNITLPNFMGKIVDSSSCLVIGSEGSSSEQHLNIEFGFNPCPTLSISSPRLLTLCDPSCVDVALSQIEELVSCVQLFKSIVPPPVDLSDEIFRFSLQVRPPQQLPVLTLRVINNSNEQQLQSRSVVSQHPLATITVGLLEISELVVSAFGVGTIAGLLADVKITDQNSGTAMQWGGTSLNLQSKYQSNRTISTNCDVEIAEAIIDLTLLRIISSFWCQFQQSTPARTTPQTPQKTVIPRTTKLHMVSQPFTLLLPSVRRSVELLLWSSLELTVTDSEMRITSSNWFGDGSMLEISKKNEPNQTNTSITITPPSVVEFNINILLDSYQQVMIDINSLSAESKKQPQINTTSNTISVVWNGSVVSFMEEDPYGDDVCDKKLISIHVGSGTASYEGCQNSYTFRISSLSYLHVDVEAHRLLSYSPSHYIQEQPLLSFSLEDRSISVLFDSNYTDVTVTPHSFESLLLLFNKFSSLKSNQPTTTTTTTTTITTTDDTSNSLYGFDVLLSRLPVVVIKSNTETLEISIEEIRVRTEAFHTTSERVLHEAIVKDICVVLNSIPLIHSDNDQRAISASADISERIVSDTITKCSCGSDTFIVTSSQGKLVTGIARSARVVLCPVVVNLTTAVIVSVIRLSDRYLEAVDVALDQTELSSKPELEVTTTKCCSVCEISFQDNPGFLIDVTISAIIISFEDEGSHDADELPDDNVKPNGIALQLLGFTFNSVGSTPYAIISKPSNLMQIQFRSLGVVDCSRIGTDVPNVISMFSSGDEIVRYPKLESQGGQKELKSCFRMTHKICTDHSVVLNCDISNICLDVIVIGCDTITVLDLLSKSLIEIQTAINSTSYQQPPTKPNNKSNSMDITLSLMKFEIAFLHNNFPLGVCCVKDTVITLNDYSILDVRIVKTHLSVNYSGETVPLFESTGELFASLRFDLLQNNFNAIINNIQILISREAIYTLLTYLVNFQMIIKRSLSLISPPTKQNDKTTTTNTTKGSVEFKSILFDIPTSCSLSTGGAHIETSGGLIINNSIITITSSITGCIGADPCPLVTMSNKVIVEFEPHISVIISSDELVLFWCPIRWKMLGSIWRKNLDGLWIADSNNRNVISKQKSSHFDDGDDDDGSDGLGDNMEIATFTENTSIHHQRSDKTKVLLRCEISRIDVDICDSSLLMSVSELTSVLTLKDSLNVSGTVVIDTSEIIVLDKLKSCCLLRWSSDDELVKLSFTDEVIRGLLSAGDVRVDIPEGYSLPKTITEPINSSVGVGHLQASTGLEAFLCDPTSDENLLIRSSLVLFDGCTISTDTVLGNFNYITTSTYTVGMIVEYETQTGWSTGTIESIFTKPEHGYNRLVYYIKDHKSKELQRNIDSSSIRNIDSNRDNDTDIITVDFRGFKLYLPHPSSHSSPVINIPEGVVLIIQNASVIEPLRGYLKNKKCVGDSKITLHASSTVSVGYVDAIVVDNSVASDVIFPPHAKVESIMRENDSSKASYAATIKANSPSTVEKKPLQLDIDINGNISVTTANLYTIKTAVAASLQHPEAFQVTGSLSVTKRSVGESSMYLSGYNSNLIEINKLTISGRQQYSQCCCTIDDIDVLLCNQDLQWLGLVDVSSYETISTTEIRISKIHFGFELINQIDSIVGGTLLKSTSVVLEGINCCNVSTLFVVLMRTAGMFPIPTPVLPDSFTVDDITIEVDWRNLLDSDIAPAAPAVSIQLSGIHLSVTENNGWCSVACRKYVGQTLSQKRVKNRTSLQQVLRNSRLWKRNGKCENVTTKMMNLLPLLLSSRCSLKVNDIHFDICRTIQLSLMKATISPQCSSKVSEAVDISVESLTAAVGSHSSRRQSYVDIENITATLLITNHNIKLTPFNKSNNGSKKAFLEGEFQFISTKLHHITDLHQLQSLLTTLQTLQQTSQLAHLKDIAVVNSRKMMSSEGNVFVKAKWLYALYCISHVRKNNSRGDTFKKGKALLASEYTVLVERITRSETSKSRTNLKTYQRLLEKYIPTEIIIKARIATYKLFNITSKPNSNESVLYERFIKLLIPTEGETVKQMKLRPGWTENSDVNLKINNIEIVSMQHSIRSRIEGAVILRSEGIISLSQPAITVNIGEDDERLLTYSPGQRAEGGLYQIPQNKNARLVTMSPSSLLFPNRSTPQRDLRSTSLFSIVEGGLWTGDINIVLNTIRVNASQKALRALQSLTRPVQETIITTPLASDDSDDSGSIVSGSSYKPSPTNLTRTHHIAGKSFILKRRRVTKPSDFSHRHSLVGRPVKPNFLSARRSSESPSKRRIPNQTFNAEKSAAYCTLLDQCESQEIVSDCTASSSEPLVISCHTDDAVSGMFVFEGNSHLIVIEVDSKDPRNPIVFNDSSGTTVCPIVLFKNCTFVVPNTTSFSFDDIFDIPNGGTVRYQNCELLCGVNLAGDPSNTHPDTQPLYGRRLIKVTLKGASSTATEGVLMELRDYHTRSQNNIVLLQMLTQHYDSNEVLLLPEDDSDVGRFNISVISCSTGEVVPLSFYDVVDGGRYEAIVTRKFVITSAILKTITISLSSFSFEPVKFVRDAPFIRYTHLSSLQDKVSDTPSAITVQV